MKAWLRLTLITMTVGGGFAGFAGTLQSLFNSPGASTLKLVLIFIFACLYVFVTVSGLLFVNDPRRTGPLVAALALQVPWISSSLITYKFAAGFESFIFVGSPEKQNAIVHLGWDFLFGSSWKFGLSQENPVRLGVNLAALAILLLLLRALRSSNRVAPPIK